MKRAHIGDILNFDLCNIQKVGQSKNPGILSCILIRCTYDKNFEMIQPLVIMVEKIVHCTPKVGSPAYRDV
jgi:hypothetical protein